MNSMMKIAAVVGALVFGVLTLTPSRLTLSSQPGQTTTSLAEEPREWPVYGGSPEGTRYSPLAQINRENVKQLRVAWSYDTKETGGLETTPLVVDGVLYAYTPTQKVFALEAATGKLLWKFDSGVVGRLADRGLATWTDGQHRRIFAGNLSFVYALDAKTGKLIPSFGEGGRIDLRENLGRDPKSVIVALTTPGIVYKDLLIVGGLNPETLPCPPGDIRAFDVRTGKLRWAFHTIPHPGEFGYETWPPEAWKYSGAANNWAGMALDRQRGIVYVPTGSAASDFYGADRVGDDLFANCLIALDAETGKRIWHFQGVKHDIWDRDFPSPPVLVTVDRGGKPVDAVAQTSKQGYVYLFDRTNGKPLFPLESKPYPPSDVPGEVAAATQSLPTRPAPLTRQVFTEDMVTNRTPKVHQWALEHFRMLRSGGQFLPFTVGKDTVIFPSYDGGAEWGGSALDPATKILYVNVNDMVSTGALEEDSDTNPWGKRVYLSQCAVCHHVDLAGSPPEFPSLQGVGKRMSQEDIATRISEGKGRMPAFTNLTVDQVNALVRFLMGIEEAKHLGGLGNEKQTVGKAGEVSATYIFTGYNRFIDPDGYPAVAPPWGTLNAINLDTGEYVWKIPFGEYPALVAQGLRNTGTMNYGGPVVTAGGLVFIGATCFDNKFHAYDKATGELLWETTLPLAGAATPATYEADGRQFVVIAAGGGRDSTKISGGVYVAFALPR